MTARLQVAHVPGGYLLVMDQLTDEDNETFAGHIGEQRTRDAFTGCVGMLAVPFRLDVVDATPTPTGHTPEAGDKA